ncbi:MAG: hypothetical protein Q8P22_00785 [Chloroflexota bacterium]|nr:hypothetical protein [Chloroflexota bacterium]
MARTIRRLGPVLVTPSTLFLLLALAILGPLLGRGHILALDSPLALNWDVSGYFWGVSDGPESVFAATYSSAPITAVFKGAGVVLPSWVAQKLLLLLLFWLCAMGAFRLPHLQGKARYYAALLYTVNPFTYVRFVSGQWGVLGAYALTPFAVAAFIQLLEEGWPRHAVKTALLLTLIGFFQVHGLVIVLLILVAIYLCRVAMVRGAFRQSLPAVLLATALFLGLNLFWMVRYLAAAGGAVKAMPVVEMSYFAASPPFSVLSLRGFWLSGPYVDTSQIIPVWWLLFGALLLLAVQGGLRMASTTRLRWLALALVASALVGVVLAAGPGWAATQPAFRTLWEHFAPYRAFRDSHKFVAILALTYAYLGAFALQSLAAPTLNLTNGARRAVGAVTALALLVPVIYALPMFGTWGQLKTTEYPTDWQEARKMLDNDSSDFNVLVLPWHMYLDFPWLPNRWKRMANPAPSYFSQPTISGDNLETAVSRTNSQDPVSEYVESVLARGGSVTNLGSLMAPLNAKYVVLLKSGGYEESYRLLVAQRDLQPIFEGETIALFRNLIPTARAYAVNDVVRVADLEDFLTSGSTGNPIEHAYLLGRAGVPTSQEGQPAAGSPRPPLVSRRSPISYRVVGANGRYLVFTLPQHTARERWRYEGQSGALNLGMMPTFELGAAEGAITFPRFYYLVLPTYILGVATVIVTGVVYWRFRTTSADTSDPERKRTAPGDDV